MTADGQAPSPGGQELDSEGRAPEFRRGDRIVTLQVPWRGTCGTIVRQILHHDGSETFWGNCIAEMDDGRLVEWNCWQLDREDGWRERWDAAEAEKAARVEARERAELVRLMAKYGSGANSDGSGNAPPQTKG